MVSSSYRLTLSAWYDPAKVETAVGGSFLGLKKTLIQESGEGGSDAFCASNGCVAFRLKLPVVQRKSEADGAWQWAELMLSHARALIAFEEAA